MAGGVFAGGGDPLFEAVDALNMCDKGRREFLSRQDLFRRKKKATSVELKAGDRLCMLEKGRRAVECTFAL